MKQILLTLFALISLCLSGQVERVKVPAIDINSNRENDISFKVIYERSETSPAYFVNGKFVSSLHVEGINPYIIKSVNVEKRDTQIGSKNYHSRIYITTDLDYVPDLISLDDIKKKYSADKDLPAIFMIDGELIEASYDEYLLDKNFILRIIVKPIEIPKGGIRYSLFKLLTRTKENIRKVNEIMIRGN